MFTRPLLLTGVLLATAVASAGCASRASTTSRTVAALPRASSIDDGRATVARLDPELLASLERAAADAERNGVDMSITSGWRSRRHQARLFDAAVATYGSEEAAARWVARPGTSVHEAGDAVDIGPDAAEVWLDGHGQAYGLCRIYANEPWHFELRAGAEHDGCPTPYADPTHDPRMR